MRRKSRRLPGYLQHKPTGQARVRIDGRDHWLGIYGSEDSHDRYDELIAECVDSVDIDATRITISELLALFWRHAKKRYGGTGKGRYGAAVNWRPIIRRLRERHSSNRPKEFGPRAFRELIETLPAFGWSRQYANQQIGRVKQIFKWAVCQELIDVTVYQRLLTVEGVRYGELDFRETEPVTPVEDQIVEATIPFMPAHIADMVRIQRLSGCRPDEVVTMRPGEFDRSGDIWIYAPRSHKTQHHGKTRRIAVGPRAQAVLVKYLLRDSDKYCFPTRRARCYSTDSYRRAIHRACERRAQEQSIELEKWSPNQLRHTLGTAVRAEFDAETAQAVLGHAKLSTTEIYAERSTQKMLDAARRLG